MWYLTSVNYKRKFIKFYSSGKDFVVLHFDRGKTKNDFSIHVVDFHRLVTNFPEIYFIKLPSIQVIKHIQITLTVVP